MHKIITPLHEAVASREESQSLHVYMSESSETFWRAKVETSFLTEFLVVAQRDQLITGAGLSILNGSPNITTVVLKNTTLSCNSVFYPSHILEKKKKKRNNSEFSSTSHKNSAFYIYYSAQKERENVSGAAEQI